MMFSVPIRPYEVQTPGRPGAELSPDPARGPRTELLTSTVRMVGSSGRTCSPVAAGVCALWGPLHGGANVAACEMLQQIHDTGEDVAKFVAKVKDGGPGSS